MLCSRDSRVLQRKDKEDTIQIKRKTKRKTELFNTKGVLLQIYFVMLHLLVDSAKMVYVPTTYQISPLSCHFYASSSYIRLSADIHTALAAKYKASFVILLVSSYISMM